MNHEGSTPIGLIVWQKLKRLLRIHSSIDRMYVHAIFLLHTDAPVSGCDCESEWHARWKELHHATQYAHDGLTMILESQDEFLLRLSEVVPLDEPLSEQDIFSDDNIHLRFARQSCIYRTKMIKEVADLLIELKFTKAELLKAVSKMQSGLGDFLHLLESAHTPRKRMNLLKGEFGDADDSLELEIPGDRDRRNPNDWKTFYYTLEILPIVIGVFAGLAKALNEAFADEADDPSESARKTALGMNCSQINAATDQTLISLINAMLDGATGNDDELAILHLLACLPTVRVRSIVFSVGINRLMFDFDGAEWDRLMLLLRHHGLVGFQSWDDDASRLFINSNAPSTLNSLALHDIATLIQNMFRGSCGDDDEQAIIRLLSCLDCGRVRQLVARPGFNVDDFDDNVDGSEWTQLKQLFRNCGIAV